MISAATIGCGRMGAFPSDNATKWTPTFWQPIAHLEALKGLDKKITLVGAADINTENRLRASERYNIPCFKSVHDLLDNHPIDLLTIATRTPDKFEIIKSAIEAGVSAIHIEKPLCNSWQEYRDLTELLKGVYVSYGCLRRYISPFTDIHSIASKNNLGAIKQVICNSGRSLLYWTHPHSIDLMQMLLAGKPLEVQATLEYQCEPQTYPVVEEDPLVSNAYIRFENGCSGVITNAPGNEFCAVFEHGSVTVVADGRSLIVKTYKGDDPYPQDYPVEFEITRSGGTRAAIAELCSALEQDPHSIKASECTKNDMLSGQLVLFAIAQSHTNSGARVALSDVDQRIQLKGIYRGAHA